MSAANQLETGRARYAERAWTKAFEALSRADDAVPLDADDLELLARSAYMLGRDGDYVAALERAYQAHADAGQSLRAVRCAFWLGLNLMPRGEIARATGWFARGQRLVEREERERVERGYLMIPALLGCVANGDHDAALAMASEAVAIAARFEDADLLALVTMEQGHALVRIGRVEEGFSLVDEVMVAVTTRQLSPVVTGIVYCNTITFCAGIYELRRAQEWTVALTRWCDEQPAMLAHTGVCLVHRAEIMELQGAWESALDEARRAGERAGSGVLNQLAAGHAHYRQAEILRLKGDFAAAELQYREASRHGWEAQPGLALLRVAQGKSDVAAAAMRRAEGETSAPLQRARLLPAYVEVMLTVGDDDAARAACRDLAEIAAERSAEPLIAMAKRAEGEVALASGDARAALDSLRHAWTVWQELDARYEAARVRVLVGLACRALGDEETAMLEFEVADGALKELGAAPDVARVESLMRPVLSDSVGLTARELEVLRLLARGATNKHIARELVISERTVDRHVSNIFVKVAVTNRSAATAYAYEHQLV